MAVQTFEQIRVVDPLLTTVAHGYRQPSFVGHLAFPPVSVKARKGRILRFNEDEFFLHEMRRSPGANVLRVAGGWGSDLYELYQDAIEEKLPIEHLQEAEAVGLPFDLQARSINKAAARAALRLEFDQISLLGDPNSYPSSNRIALTSGGTGLGMQLSNPASDPEALFDAADDAVRNACGLSPNTVIFGSRAWKCVKRHPLIRDKIKYTTSAAVTMQIVLGMLNLTRGGIAASRYKDPQNPAAGRLPMAMDNAIAIVYVPDEAVISQVGVMPSPESDMAQPSFGYTYTLENYPIAEAPYYEPNVRTWFFPHIAERRPVLTGMGAGYLITNVAA